MRKRIFGGSLLALPFLAPCGPYYPANTEYRDCYAIHTTAVRVADGRVVGSTCQHDGLKGPLSVFEADIGDAVELTSHAESIIVEVPRDSKVDCNEEACGSGPHAIERRPDSLSGLMPGCCFKTGDPSIGDLAVTTSDCGFEFRATVTVAGYGDLFVTYDWECLQQNGLDWTSGGDVRYHLATIQPMGGADASTSR